MDEVASTPHRLGRGLRLGAALWTTRAAGGLSRAVGAGSGSTIGGRLGLLVDPNMLAAVGKGRRVALVSGTNGKTTTTRLLVEALGGEGTVASSEPGANLPAGLAAALAAAPTSSPAVLEVDERYLGAASDALAPLVVVLLNLSRDQLDRMSEVRMVADAWRRALSRTPATVVANADDPLVAFAASEAASVLWVGAGGRWREDAHHCPRCDAGIAFEQASDNGGEWSCRCGFRRPPLDAALRDETLHLADGSSYPVRLALPGRFNAANAAFAAVASACLGVPVPEALAAAARVDEVAGRFGVVRRQGIETRLLLAKNPAGWSELIGLVEERPGPLVIGINARLADGHDPSWLWDVPFERLGGRFVVATGERRLDLAVRLRHAGAPHVVEADQLVALSRAGAGRVDYVGNYTAFQSLRRCLSHASPPRPVRAPPEAAPPPRPARGRPAPLSVVLVHPDLLGTYGDAGNARVLENRAHWRAIPVEAVLASSDAPLPTSGDLYCLGGGEDGPQSRSAELLREGALARAVGRGATVLGVCAGFQILGRSFPGSDGPIEGVGLLDVVTERTEERRAVGEVAAAALGDEDWPIAPGIVSGFENHQARTRLGAGARPLGRLLVGTGNGDGAFDGAVSGRVVATYLHGPVLARNPALADLLLAIATGITLEPLDDEEEEALRAERLARARRHRRLLRA